MDKDSEFYHRVVIKYLEGNGSSTYLIENEDKSLICERYIKMMENKNFKHDDNCEKCVCS